MHPYRTVRPHDPAACEACAPAGHGHQQCQNCDAIADTQVQRHATAEEYAALPVGLMPIDGVATQTVFACDDCAESIGSICTHATAEPVPCPKCKAAGDSPCLGKDGQPRKRGDHAARSAAQPPQETCQHHHRADCEIFAGCQCSQDDEPPVRPKRPRGETPGPDTSGLTIPIYAAQMVLAQAAIPWALVTAVRSCLTQDNRPAITVEVTALDDQGNWQRDQHGHLVTDTYTIALPTSPGQVA